MSDRISVPVVERPDSVTHWTCPEAEHPLTTHHIDSRGRCIHCEEPVARLRALQEAALHLSPPQDSLVSIHFESPLQDPFKVPRPLHVTILPDGTHHLRGGEFWSEATQLLGISASVNFAFTAGKWVPTSNLSVVTLASNDEYPFRHWCLNFMAPDGPYTVSSPRISRIEVH